MKIIKNFNLNILHTFHNKKSVIRLLCLGLCVVILFIFRISAFSSNYSFLQKRNQPDFNEYTNLLFQEQISGDTIGLHYTLAHPENYGILSPEISLGSLNDNSPVLTRISCENIRSACESYDYDSLSTKDQLTYDVLLYTLDQNEKGCDYYYYEEPLNSINGIQAELPVLMAEYTFRDITDIENYLKLLSLVPEYFCEIIDFEEKKSAKGLFMTTIAADDILSQIYAMTGEPAFCCLTETFPKKLENVPNLTGQQKEDYIKEHDSLIQNCLVPAYKSLSDCVNRLKTTSKNEGGLCGLPNGKNYYSYLTAHTTASGHSIDELEKMIEDERHSCLSQIKVILEEHPQILSDINSTTLKWTTPEEMLEHLKVMLQQDFPKAPENHYEIKTVEPSMQDFLSPAFYLTAPIDDPDNNNIYINPAYQHSEIDTFTTLAHEGYPGHLYETVTSYQQNFCPLRHILGFGGYTEGWATYVEMQSYEYAGLDPTLARLLQLNASATLSLYASIDIGVHAKGWDRDMVFAFLKKHGINSRESSDHIYELVIKAPANYLKYYIGYLEFHTLKKDAMEHYGSDYDNRRFHQAIMSIGPAPFSIIRKYLPLYYEKTDDQSSSSSSSKA